MARTVAVTLVLMAAACGKQPMSNPGGGGGAGGGGGGGGGGVASCSAGMVCGGLCIDPSTSLSNCGSCGHSCPSNVACIDGICGAPFTLVSGGSVVAAGPIVSDGAYVYFPNMPTVCGVTSSCISIAKCSVAGCANYFPFASPTYSRVMALDAGVLYWSDGPNLRSCATSGQCANSSWTNIAPVGGSALAADANGVYFIANTTGQVQRCPLAGCAGAMPTTLGTTSAGSTALAADGTHVFFGTATQILAASDDGSAPAAVLVGGLTGVQFLAVDGSNVYYAATTGDIGSCAKSGCAQPTAIASSSSTILGFVTDGTSLYWSDAAGTIRRCPTTGQCDTPVVIARVDTNSHIYGIAVDDAHVYYTVKGAVMRALK